MRFEVIAFLKVYLQLLVRSGARPTKEVVLRTNFLGEIDVKAVGVNEFHVHDTLEISAEVIHNVSEREPRRRGFKL